jgi:hypothetical protein
MRGHEEQAAQKQRAGLPAAVATANWTRWSGYQVVGGHIRPAPGAQLCRYDPWEAYRKARYGSQKRQPAPYESLLELTRPVLRPVTLGLGEFNDPPTLFTAEIPDPAGFEAELLPWMATHGLLGILLHSVSAVFLWPRWELDTAALSLAETAWTKMEPPPGRLYPHQRRFILSGPDWTEITVSGWIESPPRDSEALRGQPVDEELIPPEWVKSGCAVYQPNGSWELQRLETAWARFFPDVPAQERETWAYPLPLSDEFWTLYAEPLNDFLGGAATLRAALEHLKVPPAAPGSDPTRREIKEWYDVEVVKIGVARLNALVAPSRLIVAREDGNVLRQHWSSPSLFGSFALMALQDLTERRRLITCAGVRCGKVFVSSAYQATYCSNACRWVGEKRTQRETKRNSEVKKPGRSRRNGATRTTRA